MLNYQYGMKPLGRGGGRKSGVEGRGEPRGGGGLEGEGPQGAPRDGDRGFPV